MELLETSVGLPNSCTVCGKPITTKTWFAENIDGARSGTAGHKACMTKLLKGEAVAEAKLEAKAEAAEEAAAKAKPEPETYPTTASRKAKRES